MVWDNKKLLRVIIFVLIIRKAKVFQIGEYRNDKRTGFWRYQD